MVLSATGGGTLSRRLGSPDEQLVRAENTEDNAKEKSTSLETLMECREEHFVAVPNQSLIEIF